MTDPVPASSPELIIVGRVRKAHGIRGGLVVEPLTDAGGLVFAPGRRLITGTTAGDPAPDRAALTVSTADPHRGGYLVHVDEIADRTTAELWRDRYLLVPADELEPPGVGEVYVHELIGMRVELESGETVGVVAGTYDLPQGLALEVDRPGAAGSMIVPYDRIVTSVDRQSRVIRIAPPAGLLDE